MLNKDSTVFVAGHNGMVGSAVVRALEQDGFGKIITASRSKLDLLRQTDVEFLIIFHEPSSLPIKTSSSLIAS